SGFTAGCFCDAAPTCSGAGNAIAMVASVAIGGCRAMTSGRPSSKVEPSTMSQPAEDKTISTAIAIVASATDVGIVRLERKRTRRRFSGQIGRDGRRALNPRLLLQRSFRRHRGALDDEKRTPRR